MTSFIEDDCLYIIQEFAQSGDLHKVIKRQREKHKKRFRETELWGMLYEMLLGIEYLHQNNIIHRDLKPLNIFLTSNRTIKIGDMGVSRIVNSDEQGNIESIVNDPRVGTPLYLAPELIKQKRYNFKVDIWALGIIMYYLTCLSPPFLCENLSKLATSITNTEPKELPKYYNDGFKELIMSFLSKNPDERPSATEALTKVPEIIKKVHSSQFKFKESEDKNGQISSRNDSLTKATDLRDVIIPVPSKKNIVKVDIRHRSIARPSTSQNNRIKINHAVNMDKLRLKLNISEKQNYIKPSKNQLLNNQKFNKDVLMSSQANPKIFHN